MSVKALGQQYDEVLEKWHVFEDEGQIRVSLVVVKPEHRGQGLGRQIFKALNDYADASGKTITLTPDSSFGTSKGKLVKFYKSLGFVQNKGRNKDYEISDSMYRLPRMAETIEFLVRTALNEIWEELY